jgi:hypothetical protein
LSFISKIIGSNLGKIISGANDIIDQYHMSDEEKGELKIKLQEIVAKRETELEMTLRSELQAKERILVAELGQGDTYTKRARPTVVYAGMLFIFLNYCLFPVISHFSGYSIPSLELPQEFWIAFGGITATWSIGRSFERRGAGGSIVRAITGSKKHSLLIDGD